ncbi:MAG: hypothetical protein QM820_32865 [Minicystis sp.]
MVRCSLFVVVGGLILAACSSSGPGTSTGSSAGGGGGIGPSVDACTNSDNPAGPMVDLAWPAASNVGHDANEGDTVHFHWSGSHNVLQVATFEGQASPTPVLGDAMWMNEIKSGPKASDGSFDWNTGTFPCGYRPGLYYFVDEENPQGGIVSVSLTVPEGSRYAPQPCSALADPAVYGGRYAAYANRPDCMVYEVNNFQTEAHFDWVPPIFRAKQGDLIVFRWTGTHNIVQVHDVTQDALVPGGIHSGEKTNCVGGPHYACVNGPASLGEYLFDTTDYRPGIIHISDECAYTCTGHTTGMNMEFTLRYPVDWNAHPEPVAGTCCALDKSKGKSCRVVEISNANDGAQFDYNIPAGPGDLVRFRWSGSLRIYQSVPDAEGKPTDVEKPGGIAMAAPVACTPGPHMSCLEGTTKEAELVFDVKEQIAKGNYETFSWGQKYFTFHAVGEDKDGFTSASTNTIVYVDESVPEDPSPAACP